MEDQNDIARSAARALKANVVTGGKAKLAALARDLNLMMDGRRFRNDPTSLALGRRSVARQHARHSIARRSAAPSQRVRWRYQI